MKVIRHRSLFKCSRCNDEYMTLCINQDREICIECYREVTGNRRASIPKKTRAKAYEPYKWGGPKKDKERRRLNKLPNVTKRKRARKIQQQKQFLAKVVEELKRKPTYAERYTMGLMEGLIEYEFQSPFYVRGFMGVADFYLPGHRVYLEIDGGYHWEIEQAQKDKARDAALFEVTGKRTLRITNKTVFAMQDGKQLLRWILSERSSLELSRDNDIPVGQGIR